MPKNLVTLPLVYGSIFQYHENGFRGEFFGALEHDLTGGSFDFIKPALIKSDSSKKSPRVRAAGTSNMSFLLPFACFSSSCFIS